MAMAEVLQKKMTVEEFFEWQQGQDKNYELVDGVPVLPIKSMTGATDRHDRITVNTIATLHQRLRGKPCRPKTADTSIRTFRGTRRPDVSVECGRPDPKSMAADEPRLIVEILSPSTTRYDRFQKLTEYQQHPTIKVILLVDTEAPQVTGLDATIELPEIDAALPLSELYLDVTFDAT
jgi:Uma2 family endonuclease